MPLVRAPCSSVSGKGSIVRVRVGALAAWGFAAADGCDLAACAACAGPFDGTRPACSGERNAACLLRGRHRSPNCRRAHTRARWPHCLLCRRSLLCVMAV